MRKKINKNEYVQLCGLLSMAQKHWKKMLEYEEIIIELLGVEEDNDWVNDCVNDIICDDIYDDLSVKKLLNKLEIEIFSKKK
jgi:hypothetical protein